MRGHRKKLRFFARCIDAYATAQRLARAEIRVIELGSGNGMNVAIPLSKLGYEVTAVEPQSGSVAFGRFQNSRVEFVEARYESYQADRKFDIVVLSDVLEHVTDPADLLHQATELLKPDGEVLISIPNGHGPYEIEQFLIRVGALRWALVLVRSLVALGVSVKHKVAGPVSAHAANAG
jgi:2-polyprenyl-3-methyl-5-hydroxy-6-metoxy-1,4-benzoquinol methylase